MFTTANVSFSCFLELYQFHSDKMAELIYVMFKLEDQGVQRDLTMEKSSTAHAMDNQEIRALTHTAKCICSLNICYNYQAA